MKQTFYYKNCFRTKLNIYLNFNKMFKQIILFFHVHIRIHSEVIFYYGLCFAVSNKKLRPGRKTITTHKKMYNQCNYFKSQFLAAKQHSVELVCAGEVCVCVATMHVERAMIFYQRYCLT